MGQSTEPLSLTTLAERPADLLNVVLSASSDQIYLLDRHGRYLYASPAAARALGMTAQEMVGRTWRELGLPCEVVLLLERCRRDVMASGCQRRTELEYPSEDGERSHECILTPVFAERGLSEPTVVEMVAVNARDVTERKRREQVLRESEERFRLLVEETVNHALFTLDSEGRITTWNEGARRLKGYQREEIIGRHFSCFYTPEERAQNRPARLLRLAAAEGRCEDQGPRVRKDGTLFQADVVITALRDEQGRLRGFSKVTRDVSERVEAERRRRAEQTRALTQLSRVVEQISESVFITDSSGCIEYANPAFERLTGFSADQARGNTPELLRSEHHDAAFFERLWTTILDGKVYEGTLVNRRQDGSLYYEEKVITPLTDETGALTHFVSTGRDVTERVRFQSELRRHSAEDPLTGVANRAALYQSLSAELVRAGRAGGRVAVVHMDLDHFKRINDGLGHGSGDAILKAVARRLQEAVGPGYTIARMGGDEFVIVIGDCGEIQDVVPSLNALREGLQRPVRTGVRDVFVSFSTGIAIYPDDAADTEALLKHAAVATYRAKAAGPGDSRFYSPEMDSHSRELLTLEGALRQALERNQFRLHYQPQMDLRNGTIIGFEALLRWDHPDHGLMGPADFVPLLEDTGLIVPVGEWILRQACRETPVVGNVRPRISVNVSARQFGTESLLQTVREMVAEQQLAEGCLELEITEDTLMEDLQGVGETLKSLHDLGIRIAVDDFGTGYSSLAYLKRFPVRSLKIDRTFVRDLPDDPNDKAITEATISMAHKLGLTVIAEGVETDAQREFLQARGCDAMQGFYFSPPLPADEARAFLRTALGR